MKKIYRYYEDLYKAPIYFVANCSQEVAKSLFLKEVGAINDYRWGVAHTFAYTKDENTVYGIWVEDINNLETFAHEVVHLAGFIFNDRHIKYDPSNDEPFAYLIEHLFKKLKKFI